MLADSLANQDRFSVESVSARTEKGFPKSEGVQPLQEIRRAVRSQDHQIVGLVSLWQKFYQREFVTAQSGI